MASPGVDISSMMIAVRRDVIASTGGAQIPWENSSLTRQFYFAGDAASEASPETLLWRLAGGAARSQPARHLSRTLPRGLARGGREGDARRDRQVEQAAAAGGERRTSTTFCGVWRAAGAQSRLVELYLARYPSGAHARGSQGSARQPARTRKSAASEPGVVCERLATHPDDATASTPGVDLPDLRAERRRRDRRLRRGGGAPSRDRALRGAAGARDRRRRAPRGSLCALQEGGRRRRRARHVLLSA